ncbi:MAG: hypothetical protein ACYDBX_04320 [Patescibacteria group bacterium]
MKKIILLLFILFMVSSASFAQLVRTVLVAKDTATLTASEIQTGFLKYSDFTALMNKVGVTNAQVSKSINYSISTTDHFVDCAGGSGGITVTLPTAVGYAGLTFVITKTDSGVGNVTIATTSSQTINGATTYVISMQYVSITLHSDGSNWIIN